MAKHRKAITDVCTYCGAVARLTEDHVVPQCLFDGDIPGDIPRVWACATCNGDEKSKLDTFLRDMLVCQDATHDHPIARRIFETKFSRSVLRNQSALTRFLAQQRMRPVEMVTPSGLFAGIGFEAPLPSGEVSRALSMMVRGLYRVYTGSLIPANVEFEICRMPDLTKAFSVVKVGVDTGMLRYVPIGDSTIFNCIYRVEQDNPSDSIWLLAFYTGQSCGAVYRVMTKETSNRADTAHDLSGSASV